MRKRIVRVVPAVVLVGLLIAGIWAVSQRPGGWAAVLERFNLAAEDPDLIEASGFMEVETVEVAAETGGRVLEVAVAEGDQVTEGGLVAELDTSALTPQLDQARAARRAAKAALEQAEARREGAREMLQLIEDQLADLPEGAESPELEAQEASARAELRSARAAVDAAGAQVDQAGASVAAVEAQLEQTRLTVPISGEVGQVMVVVGEVVTPGQVLVAIFRPDPVELAVFVPQADIGGIRLGQPVEVRVDAHPDRAFEGSVAHVGSEAEFTPRNVQSPEERVNLVFEVRVEVPNPEGDLRPGMPADATLRRSG